ELERNSVGSLRVLAYTPGVGHKLSSECGLDLLKELCISRSIVLLTEDDRSALNQIGRMSEERRRYEVLPRSCTRIVRARGSERQPVAKMRIAGPDAPLSSSPPLVLHPLDHARVLLLENALVTVAQIHSPRNDHRRIRPCRRAPLISTRPRQDIR